jgi:pyrroline-5-carboxylate reductase
MKIGVIGCGVIGSIFAERLSCTHDLILFDRNRDKCDKIAACSSARVAANLADLVKEADLLILAIRPNGLPELAALLISLLRANQWIVSVLAGFLTDTLRSHFPNRLVVHLMPNLPSKIGKGVLAVESHSTLDEPKREEIERLFSPLGRVYWLAAEKMNGVGVVAGSAPAFIAMVMESIVDGAIALGFSAEQALSIVLEMAEGTVELLQKSGAHPAQLRWEVAAPGGTTVAGMRAFEAAGGRAALIEAIHATYEKVINFH